MLDPAPQGARFRHRLRELSWAGDFKDYIPRFRDHRFWITQSLVLFIALVHSTIEATGWMPHLGMLYFVPTSLFFLPLLYAALNFGWPGTLATAVWIILLSLPNWILWHTATQRAGVIFEMVVLTTAALLIGNKVEKERRARTRAEVTNLALTESEARYRMLFQSSPVAMLMLETGGKIIEANPAAGSLFGRSPATLPGLRLGALIGAGTASQLLSTMPTARLESFSLPSKSGPEISLRPILFSFRGLESDEERYTLVLRNVTEEQKHEAGLKAYAASVLRSQEEERKRIAREIHDDIIQELIVLHRSLDSAEAAAEATASPMSSELSLARRNTEEAVRRLRRFTTSLRPPSLDDLGMVVSIRSLLVSLADTAGLESSFEVEGHSRRLKADAELGLFRIAQEALRNVERHADAVLVNVTIRFERDLVRLEIRDNGKGFPAVRPDLRESGLPHLGIISMQERAELLGGWLEIDSAAGGGTKVVATIRA